MRLLASILGLVGLSALAPVPFFSHHSACEALQLDRCKDFKAQVQGVFGVLIAANILSPLNFTFWCLWRGVFGGTSLAVRSMSHTPSIGL